MSIITSPSRSAKPGWTPTERPRGTAPARLGGRPGVSRDVLRDLNAAAKREQQPLVPPQIRIDPTPDLYAAVNLLCGTYWGSAAILGDIGGALDELAALIEQHRGDHTARMLLMPYAARIVELFGTEETGTEADR